MNGGSGSGERENPGRSDEGRGSGGQGDTGLDPRLAFFGAITASVTHELNNILSILDQVNGLLADCIAGAGEGGAVPAGLAARVEEKIGRQIERGEAVIKRLNRFAHSVDDPQVEFDLVEVVANLAALSQRFAELKRVRLEEEYPGEAIRVTGDAFALQQVLFACLRLLLAAAEEGAAIRVRVAREGNGAVIGVSGPRMPGEERLGELRDAIARPLEAWGATLEAEQEGEGGALVIRLPAGAD